MATTRLLRFISILGGRAGTILVTLLLTPFLVRILGSEGFGEYSFAFAVYSTLRILSGGGILEGARKYIAEERSIEWRTRVIRYYFGVATFSGSLTAVALALGTYAFVGPVVLDELFRPHLYLVALLVLIQPFFYLVRSSLMGLEMEHVSESLLVGQRVTFAIVGLLLASIGFGVRGVLAGHVVAVLLTTWAGLFVLFHWSSIRPIGESTQFAGQRSNEMFIYGLSSVVLVLLTKSLYYVDLLLLQPFTGSTQVGYYRASLMVAEFLWFVPIAVQTFLLHSSSRVWAEREMETIETISRLATRYTLLLTLLLALGIAALSEEFLRLYFGAEFTAAVVPLLLLLPGSIGFAVSRPIFAIGQGHGDLRTLIYATGVAAALNLALNLLLIPWYGATGAAIATSFGYGSMLFLHVWSAKRIGFDPVKRLRLTRIGVTALIAFPIVFWMARTISRDLVAVTIVPPLGFAVYLGLAVLFRAIEPSEVKLVVDWVVRRTNFTP